MSNPFDWTAEPLPIRIHEREGLPGTYTHQITALFSMKEVAQRAQRDIMPWVMSELGDHLTRAVSEFMVSDRFEDTIAAIIKDEVRAQVKAYVAQRIDEFVEEVL